LAVDQGWGLKVLYKRDTAAAREARLKGSVSAESEAVPATQAATAEQPKPDPRDREIARLEAERAELQRQIEALRNQWQAELAKAEARASEAAAREHVKDDEARLAALVKALDDARQGFDAALGQNQADLAIALALAALSRLVEPNRQDRDWLARAIQRRLAELRAQTVVSLRVAADGLAPEALARLRHSLAAGAAIETDPDLAPGQARIELQLGAVNVDLSTGLAAVVGQLEASDAEA
jgi:flagellar biosynthesis/type III secretory pathway protein FliH